MATTGITKSPFEKFYGEKSKIIGFFSEFRRIACVTKWDKLKKHMTYKMYKDIMAGYAEIIQETHTSCTILIPIGSS